MRDLAERGYYGLCRALGWALRSSRYATARVVTENGRRRVRKRRRLHAPLLVRLGAPLARVLATGVRVLPQRAWEARERDVYRTVYGASIEVEGDGTLVLPWLGDTTLAALLEDPARGEADRRRAIALAAAALADFHRHGLTHGDAMAENVMIDLDVGAARWFDFETVHDPRRPPDWRRADDVRALVATCVVRAAGGDVAATLRLVLDVYADEPVARSVAASFESVWRRALGFHLGQAALSFGRYREIGGLLRARRRIAIERRGPDGVVAAGGLPREERP